MPTVLMLVLLSTFVCTIVSAMGKCPLWVAVLLLTIAELIGHIPLR